MQFCGSTAEPLDVPGRHYLCGRKYCQNFWIFWVSKNFRQKYKKNRIFIQKRNLKIDKISVKLKNVQKFSQNWNLKGHQLAWAADSPPKKYLKNIFSSSLKGRGSSASLSRQYISASDLFNPLLWEWRILTGRPDKIASIQRSEQKS